MSFTANAPRALACLALIAFIPIDTQAQLASSQPPVRVGSFEQQIHIPFTDVQGLPSNDVRRIGCDAGTIAVQTPHGDATFANGAWLPTVLAPDEAKRFFGRIPYMESLAKYDVPADSVRTIAEGNKEFAVAAASGLYIGDRTTWALALPQQGAVRWAPSDVRGVAYDAEGRLWFACPQGVGYRVTDTDWRLFTGSDGLPFNDFTCVAAGPRGVWFGTTNGAIHYDGEWHFRQGRRWLLDNHVNDIAVDSDGNAWIATNAGVSKIEYRTTTLADKARYFESEIDKYHRRTHLGYVNPCIMTVPGDKSTAVPQASDNDGHFGGLYLAAASLGYAATRDPKLQADAHKAFEALAFLSEVTSGGTHPAPKGFISRAVVPTTEPDPNLRDDAAMNERRVKADTLWKQILPRWPIDATGEWYWKCDSSSDELDGHFFGFGVYYDRVCETDEQKDRVRAVVRRIIDHIIDNDYYLVDHDGKPTRWGHLAPEDLNKNPDWWVERGLNSGSMLAYLSVAHHVTGDQKYRDEYLKLINEHGYAMNLMTQPKVQLGPGSFGQADDNMAFMNYYMLMRYETDENLLGMYRNALWYHWHFERCERNPFFNFIYASISLGKTRTDPWGTEDFSPPASWLDESIDTLKRYPLDLVDWPMSNAHRIDMIPLPANTRGPGSGHATKGSRVTGTTYPIDENHAIYWGDDPWELSSGADGTRLREGVSFMLAYYLGVVHGYIAE